MGIDTYLDNFKIRDLEYLLVKKDWHKKGYILIAQLKHFSWYLEQKCKSIL